MSYYVGLDIGTNSVGWAVTDPQYNIPKYNGKRMWGIRLFEEAETAEGRRMKRTNRRRLSRRKQRIDLLQELFASEMQNVDPTFFIRLNESRLYPEDKTVQEKFPLFIDKTYTDVEYYRQYPTIYHLRKELIENKEPHDIRLVYLACHHILKNRGHFLIDGELSDAKNLSDICEQMLEALNDFTAGELEIKDMTQLERNLKDSIVPKSIKAKNILALLAYETCEDKERETICKKRADQLSKLLAGNKGDIRKIFNEELEDLENPGFKFSDTKYEESILPELEEKYPDEAAIVQKIKTVYDWSVLVEILNGEDYLSYAKVKAFEKHRENLHILKKLIRAYCEPEVYRQFFGSPSGKKANYANYVGSYQKNGHIITAKKCTEEDFYKELKSILEAMQPEAQDAEIVNGFIQAAENHTLLPLLRSKDNGVIPNQVHVQELEMILKNAEQYLPFLKQTDVYGSVADKIISIAKFRIPYYVGPLSTRHANRGSNAWMVRKQEGRIYPWNFEEMVDSEKSNEKFIRRMTNKCTYLVGEDVLPKNSLLYAKFIVLNELNNLKVRGKKISVADKQAIYHDLFGHNARVTGKKLLQYLQKEDPELKAEDLSGFDENFKSSLTAYLDFKKQVLQDRIEEEKWQQIVEDIIKWKTIYGDDTKMLKHTLKSVYPDVFNDTELQKICTFRYSGWGNFSEKFLNGIEGADKDTGEIFTLIVALWNTNHNLMQLLSGQFTFRENIEAYNADKEGKIEHITYASTVENLLVSPANKRAIWQTMQIMEEIRKVMKEEPEKIFVEMARGGEKEKTRKASRKARLLELYAGCEQDARDWTKEIEERDEREFNSRKLYLYYTQMGKCMYTGDPIDIHELMLANSKWDIDHIYPQSKIKDDSLDNMVLAKKTANSKKGNKLLSADIRNDRKSMWQMLLEKNLISKKKYDRLMRNTDFTDEELAGFIERQLVETRQSTKAVGELLDRVYEHTDVVYVKAGLVSDFRHDHNLWKSRRVNDYHHAKDAYLNIVVGNVYNAKFTSNPLQWIKRNRKTEYSIRRVFDFDVKRGENMVWYGKESETPTINKILKTMKRNDILYTEYCYCGKGQLFDETLAKKGNENAISLKVGLDPVKYGGYMSPKTAAFAFISAEGKKKQRQNFIVEIPVYIHKLAGNDETVLRDYLEEKKGYVQVEVKKYPIKKNALLVVDGYPMRLRGATEVQLSLKNTVQLVLKEEYIELVHHIEKFLDGKKQYEANEKFDGFTAQQLNDLYDELTEKMKDTIYNKRPANQAKNMEKGKEEFIHMDSLTEKARILNEILNLFRCDATTTANLKLIGGSANAGNIAIGKNTLASNTLILVQQSITGVYEKREELL